MSERVERRLAAIVSVDVAGYSRLMAFDEVSTVRTLTAYREDITRLVGDNAGRVVDNPGDNALLEFSSATDALSCALAIQEIIAGRNEGVPTDRRMLFRIGVHVGEVMVEGERIYGDGVNVAARLEAMAPVGGIVVSSAVKDQVGEKLGVPFTDLGDQHLKNIPYPVRVHQVHTGVEAPGWSAPRPPGPDSNLPVALSSLVGRNQAIDEVRMLLGEARFVTLAGSGGVGKTRLAVAVARDSISDFPDGVWFVDLTKLDSGDSVLAAIGELIGVEPPALRTTEEALLDATRHSAMLFVLDNCEHMTSAAAHAATVLLRASPRVRILATSQEELQVAGEFVWRVPSLTVPEPDAEVEAIKASAAVDLFLQRARAAGAAFEVADDNAGAVASICRHVAGIPLALELAAARTRTLGVEELASHLAKTFDVLTGGGRDLPPRQRTLRATIEWSYGHLDGDARAFFDQLGVFNGSFTVEAVSIVTGVGIAETLDSLDGLVTRSLVQALPGEQRRFRMLGPLRHFALERLEADGQLEALRTRHLEWMLDLCLEEAQKLMTSEQLSALAELREDLDDVRAALRWSLESGRTDIGLRMSSLLGRFWFLAAMHKEGADWLERFLGTAPRVSDLDLGRALTALASTLNHIGRTEEAASHALRAVELLEPLGEPQALGWAQFYRAITAAEPRYTNAAEVEEIFQASLRSFQEAGYAPGIGLASLLLAALTIRRDPDQGLTAIAPLLAAAEQTNNANLAGHCLEFIGFAHSLKAEFDKVPAKLAGALRLHAEVGNWACMCHTLETICDHLVGMGRELDAARIVGGTDTLRGTLATVQAPYEQFLAPEIYDWIDRLDTRSDLAPARREGRAWSREELVEHSLQYLAGGT